MPPCGPSRTSAGSYASIMSRRAATHTDRRARFAGNLARDGVPLSRRNEASFPAFARSLGYLDWASQPRPFRGFADTPVFPLYPTPGVAADGYAPGRATFDQACRLEAGASADQRRGHRRRAPARAGALGVEACSTTSRWALRVNPSSGNLHPTEAYVVCGAVAGLSDQPAVYHYAPDRHALEQRCVFDDDAWRSAFGGRDDVVLVALTSIHWREAWKYGERAFRYCQHDLGHAIAAVSIAAGLAGWRAVAAAGVVAARDRRRRPASIATQDFVEAEREEPGCIMALTAAEPLECSRETARAARRRHLARPVVGPREPAERGSRRVVVHRRDRAGHRRHRGDRVCRRPSGPRTVQQGPRVAIDARALLLQRRSAVAFDGRSTIDRAAFIDMLSRVLPARGAVDQRVVDATRAPRHLRPPRRRRPAGAVPAAARSARRSTGCEPRAVLTSCGRPPTNDCRCGA